MKNKRPPFHSIYSDLVFSNRVKTIIIFLLFIVVFFAMKNNTKPPLVIRFKANGVNVSDNYIKDSAISNFDIELFIKHFIEKLNFLDSFTLEYSIPQALNMMDSNLKNYYRYDICKPGFVKNPVAETTGRSLF